MQLPKGKTMKVFTVCSGTDSPIAALHEIFGAQAIDHVVSVDRKQEAEQFARANFSPSHFYQTLASCRHDASICSICLQNCTAIRDVEADLMIGG